MSDQPIRILLIEDNPGDVRLLREHLKAQPVEVRIDAAGNLSDGIKRLAESPSDVILLDLGLPDSPDHKETLRRALSAAQDVPIVVVTGMQDESLGIEAMHLGAQDYLLKEQVSGSQVMRSIRYAMERKSKEAALRRAHDELDQRVRERTAQLQRTLDELHEEYRRRARLEREILRIGEMERQRIGYDLHDTLGSKLAGVAFLAKALQRQLESQERPEARLAGDIKTLLNEAISHIRAIARGLRQVELQKGDLEKALGGLLEDVEQVFHVKCELEMDCPVRFSDPSQASHLYRIVTESINNAVKHGQPKCIRVGITRKGRRGLLTVRNDGKALPADFEQSKGMGIETMQYRAKIIGGRLDIGPNPDGGTLVACSFPLKRELGTRD